MICFEKVISSTHTSPRETSRLLARLRIRDLQLLVTLGRERSLRSAAAGFAVTQPALSRTLAEIESAFGFALFVRSARGVEPTPEGEVAIRGAAMVLEELAHLHEEAAQGRNARALVRLGAPPFIAQGYLPPLIARLGALSPPVRVQLSENGVPLLLDDLQQGRLDAVVGALQGLGDRDWSSALRYERLFKAGFTVIGPRGHRLGRASRVGWAELAREPWILPLRESSLYRLIEDRFIRARQPMPVPMLEIVTPVTAVRMAAQGVGLAVVPSQTLDYMRAQRDVCSIRAYPALPPIEVGLVSRAGAQNPRVQLLREVLVAPDEPVA